jgi:ribosomal-protein-alanine N-acetyltransferase
MLSLRRANGISVRDIGPFDLGRLSRLHRSCFEEAWSRADLAHLLALPGGFGLIARLYDGRFAGLDGIRGAGFSLCRVVRDESELLSIGVAPHWRGRGIARALLRVSMERCLQNGAATMFLEVAIDNEPARQLYLAHGFEQVGTRPDYYLRPNGGRVTAHTMRCDLLRVCGPLRVAS